MNTALYIIFALILIFAAWGGYKRGLVLSTAHLAAIAVSLYLACLLSSAFSGEVVSGMVPFAEGFLDHQIEETVIPEMKLDASYSVKDTLELHPNLVDVFCTNTYRAAGIAKGPAAQMSQEAQNYASTQMTDIPTAITQVFCQRMAYVAGTAIAFILVLVLLLAIGNIPNLTFRIPKHPRLDDVGGTLMGLLNGVAYCVLLCWLLQFAGILIGKGTLDQNILARIFSKIDILTLGVGI